MKAVHCCASVLLLSLLSAPPIHAQTIDLAVQKGTSTQRFYAGRPPAAAFVAGDHVNASVNLSAAHQTQFKDQQVEIGVTLSRQGESLVQHAYALDYDGYRQLQVALVPNPAVFPNESWSGRYALALARLSPGRHALALQVTMTAAATTETVASLELQFDNSGGSADYAHKARAIEEKAGKSPEELEQAFIADAGEMQIDASRYSIGQRAKQITATAVNNCGNASKPFRHGESDWITLDGGGGRRSFTAAVGTPVYRSDAGSPKLVTTLSESHQGANISLCH
jgi:hypothetical protein